MDSPGVLRPGTGHWGIRCHCVGEEILKVLMFGDLQVSCKNRDYMDNLDSTAAYLCETIRAVQPDLVVNMGDTFDTFGVVDVQDLVWVYQFSRLVANRSRGNYWVIGGNHDACDKSGLYSGLDILRDIPGLTLFRNNPDIVSKFLIVPYTREQVPINDLPKGSIAGVFGHAEWKGCKVTPSFVSPDGYDIGEFASAYPDALIFNGHYHNPDQLGPLTLVGSPLHKDFNDDPSLDRGFVLWDTDTGKIERISNPYSYRCLDVEYHDLPSLTEHLESFQNVQRYKMKVRVPSSLVDGAKDICSGMGFLWSAVYPLESKYDELPEDVGVRITSTPEEVINQGISLAGEGYDKDLLLSSGRKAFGL